MRSAVQLPNPRLSALTPDTGLWLAGPDETERQRNPSLNARMPSMLSEADKETVKRTVPKAANKIQAVAVARLYVAHPNKQRWTYTGLQGAAVLANDLVGNTFWIKLVDISVGRPGYDTVLSWRY